MAKWHGCAGQAGGSCVALQQSQCVLPAVGCARVVLEAEVPLRYYIRIHGSLSVVNSAAYETTSQGFWLPCSSYKA